MGEGLVHARDKVVGKFKVVRIPCCFVAVLLSFLKSHYYFLIGIHSSKAEQPLHGMELQEKEAQKDLSTQESSLERSHS